MAKPIKPTLTKLQQEAATWLIATVVRDSMSHKRKPSQHDATCRALTAANAYLAGVQQLSRAASPGAPDRRDPA